MSSWPLRLTIALVLLACGACATGGPTTGRRWQFFGETRPGDAWYEKVAAWQQRAGRDRVDIDTARGDARGKGLIRVEIARFRDVEKRALARRISEWSQAQARAHYRLENDADPADDHWPTFKQLLERNGDDCDGLDLIAYELLREFGFAPVYRAIVRRDRDGANHMVTLWFEDPEDPWVIDATGAITVRMRRYSDLPPGWTPRQIFDEAQQFRALEALPVARRE